MSKPAWRSICRSIFPLANKSVRNEHRALLHATHARLAPADSEAINNQLASLLSSTASRLPARPPPMNTYAMALQESQNLMKEPHRFYIYCHKHNLHLTLTRPDGGPLVSLSCGNVGFKKHQRGTYEAAFQLSSYMLRIISERGFLQPAHKEYIERLELVFKGWGDGRTAFQTALLGVEGKYLRPTIIQIYDATRLKIGGNRSKKPRRLG